MGEIGDYWREHKEHRRNEKDRQAMGMTRREYAEWQRKCAKKERDEKEAMKRVLCECGKRLLDESAHNHHKMHKGKKGHAIIAIKEREPEEDNWAAF